MWPKYDPFIAKTCSSNGPSNGFYLNFNQCSKGFSMPNFTLLAKSCSPLCLQMAKTCPFMAKTWHSHCPSNCIFLNLNYCAQGCSMPNFTLLGLSGSPLSYKWPNMALLWQNMALKWSFKSFLPESCSLCPGMFHAKFHFSGLIL